MINVPSASSLMQIIQEPNSVLPSEKFYLSTEPYWFFYRLDKYSRHQVRATLYHGVRKVDDVGVTTPYDNREHHDVINYFEARLSMGQIK